MKPVILIGAGGHARVLLEALKASGREIVGILDPSQPKGSELRGVPVLGGDEALQAFKPSEVKLVLGVGSLGKDRTRIELFEKFKNLGFTFAPVVHPSAILAGDFKQTEGVQIMAGVVIQPGVQVGTNVILNTGCHIDHDCEIQNHCHIAPGVTLSGGVRLGENVHIGTGAVVIQSITIAKDAFVAAGAVVVNDLMKGERIYPARSIIKKENTQHG